MFINTISLLGINVPVTVLEWLKFIGIIVGIIAGLFSIGVAVFTQVIPGYRTRKDRRYLTKGLSSDLYQSDVIERATRYYIEPDCQSLDPAGTEEPRLTLATKQRLFAFVDDTLSGQTQHRYIIVLADTGMGKSSFLLNYYARHLRRTRLKFDIALIPLGIPGVNERISELKNPEETVLFLDALDEDTLAIKDHAERLRVILDLTRKFRKIIITCRTQFFPKDEEIPKETGIVKVAPRDAGERGDHLFHKLYLSPFTDKQVEVYLNRRYSFWQREKRKKAREMVEKVPNLTARPMLLSYINDLVLSDNEEVYYSFELYEKMVDAWLVREEGVFKKIKKESLLKFSEQLAVDLYLNREQRGAERIPRGDVIALANQWDIPLDNWQLTGRSLLNRDAVGNHKFAHRSIMEYLIVKRFIDGDRTCAKTEWTDQMKTFLWEMTLFHLDNRVQIPSDVIDLGLINFNLSLRSCKLDNPESSIITEMIQNYNFFDINRNKKGKGVDHYYEVKEESGQKIVVDYATGLTWQRSGSDKSMSYEKAKSYVDNLNDNEITGKRKWRLPTLEEAMSLMERTKKNSNLYIDSVFDNTQSLIWTSDLTGASRAWVVYFNVGYCFNCNLSFNFDGYVRAVR